MKKTLTELYRDNTLTFGFEMNGVTLVDEHKVSFNLIQSLGKIFAKMAIGSDGEIHANDLMETMMGCPSEATRLEVKAGLGKHYNPSKVYKDIKEILEADGELGEQEIKEAAEDLLLMMESRMISSLFEAYLDKSHLGDSAETPR